MARQVQLFGTKSRIEASAQRRRPTGKIKPVDVFATLERRNGLK